MTRVEQSGESRRPPDYTIIGGTIEKEKEKNKMKNKKKKATQQIKLL